MMSEKLSETLSETPTAVPKKRKQRNALYISLGIVVVLALAAGASAWSWHEEPAFCGAICHTPMDKYLESYQAESGEPTVDKFGAPVTDARALLAVTHAQAGEGCLDCHAASPSQQLGELSLWVSGGYHVPLEERSLHDLLVNSGQQSSTNGNEFCLVEGCHYDSGGAPLTEESLKSALWSNPRYGYRNPHNPPLDSTHNRLDYSCGDCHKSHRASVQACSQCHNDLNPLLPDGWQNYSQGALNYQQN